MARAASRRGDPRIPVVLLVSAIVALGYDAASADRPGAPAAVRAPRPVVAAAPSPPARTSVRARLGADFRIRDAVRDGDTLRVQADGGRFELTVDAGLQAHLARELARYEVPYGAAVALDPRSGRVLAYVSHSSADPAFVDRVRRASAPSASVFKIITTSALLDRGVSAQSRVCYGGGLHGITLRDLADDPARDTRCATLTEALAGSINSVYAKLSDRHLDRRTIARYASAFGYGEALPFDLPIEASAIDVPEDRLERARAAAGFYHSQLSPLHGALIAATIANGGAMMRPSIVERFVDAGGNVSSSFEAREFRQVVGAETARTVARMMERTASHGTARSAFFDPQGLAFLPNIRVAGKTGTLDAERGSLTYTWFVGFAPADRPTIAIATLVVNRPEWRIKASYLAREGLRYHLVERPRREARATR